MKILICDDERAYAEHLQEHIQYYMDQRAMPCQLVLYTDPRSVVQDGEAYDLAFLDIQMDDIDGISLAKVLKERNSKVAIFFVTNFEEYQDDAMDLRAFRFFSKPFDPQRLYTGLDKAMEYIDGAYVDVILHGDEGYRRFTVDDILYVMRDNRRVVIVTKDGEHRTRESFDQLCAKLPTLFFYLVHNSFFVNLHYVQTYSYSELIMDNGMRISIATRKQTAFRKFWFEYLRRR